MTRHIATRFAARWVVSGLGLWVAGAILRPEHLELGYGKTPVWEAAIIAGFILAIVNMFLRPLLIFLSIPAILISLGLFMLVVNGFLILIVSWLYSPLYVKNLGWAILAGIIVGLVNFLVTKALEDI